MDPIRTPSKTLEAYCTRLAAAGLDAPWSRPGPLIPAKATRVEPMHWRWADIERLLQESARFVAPGRGSERRILRLANPGVPERTSTHTLSVAVQYLLPGETAPLHRHTPNALRFMLRGAGAYTLVDGERCAMAPGDLVVTPSMSWHEHGNTGDTPVIWLDGLDSPMVRFLELLKMESPPGEPRSGEAAQGVVTTPPNARRARRTLHYRWETAYATLLDRAAGDPDPYDDVLVEYLDPETGSSLFPTMACYLQMLRPGVVTRMHRQTSSAVYHVVRGRGRTIVDGREFAWTEGDFFAIPPLAPHGHANPTAERAVLFSVQDVPLVRALGLCLEEPAAAVAGRAVTAGPSSA